MTRATIKDVSRVAGVSIKTVSRVLNTEPGVRESTRARVLETVAALNYRPDPSARSLAGNPRLLLLDEPTEGLAPQVVELVGRCLHELRSRGVAVLLVEQKLGFALGIADRCLVMGHGRIVFDGAPQLLREADALRREWLEV